MRRVLCLLAALLFCASPLAVADDVPPVEQPSKEGSNAVGACLDAGNVWLYVTDVDGTVVANQCVGTPDNGEAALRAANVTVEHDKGGLICALGGRPDPCPAKFDGSFWNYWHASADKGWEFSSKGAKEWKPKPGTIEGWCRNSKDTEGCTPKPLRVEIDGKLHLPEGVAEADLANPEVVMPEPMPESDLPTGTVVAVGVIVVLGAAAVVIVRQRRRGASQA